MTKALNFPNICKYLSLLWARWIVGRVKFSRLTRILSFQMIQKVVHGWSKNVSHAKWPSRSLDFNHNTIEEFFDKNIHSQSKLFAQIPLECASFSLVHNSTDAYQATKCNSPNYFHMSERPHVPRRPCLHWRRVARRSEDGEDVFRPIVLLSGCHKNSGGEIGTSTRVLRDTSNCHLLWRHIFENLKHFILHDIGQRKKDNCAKSGKLVPT